MWFRVKFALVAWVITAGLLALSRLLPAGWARDIWLVLPMITGLLAITMSFLGAAEVASEMIGRWSGDPEALARAEPAAAQSSSAPSPRRAA